MPTTLANRKQVVLDAIADLYADTSIDELDQRDALEEVQDEINLRIDALNEQIERKSS